MVISTITLLNIINLFCNLIAESTSLDSGECIVCDYYQRLTLESWFTNVQQMPQVLNQCQQLPALY